MDMEEMMRMSGQGRDEILCENHDNDYGFGGWDERSRHGSPYEDSVTFDDDEDFDEYGMDAIECANYFECGYGRAEI